ncbi:MAG: alanine--tRNA ligase, partial [Candidatus Stahlbacteria bacterium]|nr:alanine--tRNA ligase [Candidatus Stahlbacteria bacterium]
MNLQELRALFIEFFSARSHTVVPSAGLIPTGDPTLLFTSAGMVQFKKMWSGEVSLPFTRVVSCQKCLRASDIEQVGKSLRHLTFFEMLGNFSFGDYFKHEAIEWAAEFVTKVIHLPQDKLYISVLDEDEESYNIWKNEIGMSDSRIYKLGKEHNFWGPAGGRGPCGPCSEIYYDLGKEVGCGKLDCKPGCECDRFIEIWNLVFPQYDAAPEGTLKPLKNRGIDTGAGLERLALVMENKKSLFELEVFKPIIVEIEQLFSMKYEENKTTFNIIADHIRALTFAIAEGIYPSNIGRGYLLRHILRRAQTCAFEMGIKNPFLYKLVPVVAEVMRDQYPELIERRESVSLVVKSEEENFLRTLDKGTEVFNQVISEANTCTLSGENIFKLYDTYGFPPELTYELAKGKGFESNKLEFEKLMELQKERARTASKFEAKDVEWQVANPATSGEVFKCNHTEFVGYDTLTTKAKIVKWRNPQSPTPNPQSPSLFELVLDRTTFYAESGGQVGDCGRIYNDNLEFDITDTQKLGDLYVHLGSLKRGNINTVENPAASGDDVICEVDKSRRKAIERNHTGTHLLHSALRKVLGNWVHQEGSLVEPDRIRFDFTHFKPIEQQEMEKIEHLINNWILENIKVEISATSYEEAVKEGAIAIFGEKYGEKVRVVQIGDISTELCAGTHIRATGEIGILKIIAESSVHAGIRRIEAITGDYALQWLNKYESELKAISNKLGVPVFETQQKVNALIESETRLKNRLSQFEQTQILGLVPEILSKKQRVKDISVLVAEIPSSNIDTLRLLADKLREGEKRVGVI